MAPKKSNKNPTAQSTKVESKETAGRNGSADSKIHELTAQDVGKEENRPASKDDKEQRTENTDESAARNRKTSATSNKKRKNDSGEQPASKATRRTARGASKPTHQQLLNFLLTSEARDLATPQDEREASSEEGGLRTYSSSVFSPFEELLCAVVLSRPISHKLGMRTIRTILNAPYNFNSARAIKDAGEEKQRQALDDAKTQHRGKTVTQIGDIADLVLTKFTSREDADGTRLQKVLDDSDRDIDEALSLLKDDIKGLGNTGVDIFHRRVQWLWTEGYPFVDGKTRLSLKGLGLPEEAQALQKLISDHWSDLDVREVAGEDDETKQRRAFVIVLERAVGADLEGALQSVIEAAAASLSS